jgi:hypothetical protein
MNQLFDRILDTPDRSPAPLLLVRGVAGFVFLLEGILKFVTPDKFGTATIVANDSQSGIGPCSCP